MWFNFLATVKSCTMAAVSLPLWRLPKVLLLLKCKDNLSMSIDKPDSTNFTKARSHNTEVGIPKQDDTIISASFWTADLAGIVGRAPSFQVNYSAAGSLLSNYCVLHASFAFFPFLPFSNELDLRWPWIGMYGGTAPSPSSKST